MAKTSTRRSVSPSGWGHSPRLVLAMRVGGLHHARSPNLNAFAERFVLSIKSECLNKIIPLGKKHLGLAVKEYMEHYYAERNHQGLASRIILADENLGRSQEAVKTKSRHGGFLNYYYREAA